MQNHLNNEIQDLKFSESLIKKLEIMKNQAPKSNEENSNWFKEWIWLMK